MITVEPNSFVIGQGIVCYTNIYTNIDDLLDSTKTLDWYEWHRANGMRVGIATTLTANNKTLYERFDISENIFRLYCESNNLNYNDYFIRRVYEIRKWDNNNGGMMAHADHTAMGIPAFTLSYYLTDGYIDGEIEFPSYNLSLKAEANSVVVFPSSILHSVRNVPEGLRITMQDFIYDKKSENERINNYD